MNYLSLLEIWDIVENGYVPKYGNTTNKLTAVPIEKKENNSAVNAIFTSVHESIAMLFGNFNNAHEMWKALVNRYEGSTQVKRTKIMGLEIKFENFRVEDGESIEDMYSRLMYIKMNLLNWMNLYLIIRL